MRFVARTVLVSLAAFVGLANAARAADPAPIPVAVPSDLPEIGRTKSAVPACSAMQDLVIPSFAAAKRADARFTEIQARLPRYAELKADAKRDPKPTTPDDVFFESALAKLDQGAANMLGYAAFIAKALGDPRLAPSIKDPDVRAERAQLQAIYAIQVARAQAVAEFVQRERGPLASSQLTLGGGMGPEKLPLSVMKGDPTGDIPAPAITAPPGLPLLSGNAFADKERTKAWGDDMAGAVAASENGAAKAFIPIAKRCQ